MRVCSSGSTGFYPRRGPRPGGFGPWLLGLALFGGVATGIGAAIGDGVLAAIGAFGITWLMALIEGNRMWIQGVGGLIVLAMGARTFFMPPSDMAPGKYLLRPVR